MKKSSLFFKARIVYSRADRPDRRSFCFPAFTNHKLFCISPLWQIGIDDQSLVQEPQKCCCPAPVVSDLISVQCQTHNCWEMHSCLQHSKNCLHCSANTWMAEARIGDSIALKVSKQLQIPAWFQDRLPFCQIITGKNYQLTSQMKPINIRWETESCLVKDKD